MAHLIAEIIEIEEEGRRHGTGDCNEAFEITDASEREKG